MVRQQTTGWVGWVYFAAVMLMVIGGFQMIAGLTGIFNPNYYVVMEAGQLLAFDYSTWGWTQLILGVIAVAVAIGLTLGKVWAQIGGITIGVLLGIVNLALLSVYPLWSLVSLVIVGLIVYAITLHGDEVKA